MPAIMTKKEKESYDKLQAKNKKVTIRASGKCHPAILVDGYLMACCKCPGSNNGSLAAKATIIADGHEKVNCRKP